MLCSVGGGSSCGACKGSKLLVGGFSSMEEAMDVSFSADGGSSDEVCRGWECSVGISAGWGMEEESGWFRSSVGVNFVSSIEGGSVAFCDRIDFSVGGTSCITFSAR